MSGAARTGEAPRLEAVAGLVQQVSARGVAFLAGELPDGRKVFVFERPRPTRSGSTHVLCATPAVQERRL